MEVGWRGLGEPALDAPDMYLRRIVVSVKDAWGEPLQFIPSAPCAATS